MRECVPKAMRLEIGEPCRLASFLEDLVDRISICPTFSLEPRWQDFAAGTKRNFGLGKERIVNTEAVHLFKFVLPVGEDVPEKPSRLWALCNCRKVQRQLALGGSSVRRVVRLRVDRTRSGA